MPDCRLMRCNCRGLTGERENNTCVRRLQKAANAEPKWTLRGNTVMHNIAVMADCNGDYSHSV